MQRVRNTRSASSPFFMRRPSQENPRIVMSWCLECAHLVGASPSNAHLVTAEGAHHCAEQKFAPQSERRLAH